MLEAQDFVDEHRVVLRDHRHRHIRDVHRASVGATLRAGKLNGMMGSARIESLSNQELVLEVNLDTPPPPKLPLLVILALPRPKMLRRILRSIGELGVEQLFIINSYRVEKSFWHSPMLQPAALKAALIDGLQQARDTGLPSLELKRLFKPFIEDELATLVGNRQALVAHPGNTSTAPRLHSPSVLAIGPEGGFIDYEIELLRQAGFTSLSFGPRILRVENAIPYGVGKLFG